MSVRSMFHSLSTSFREGMESERKRIREKDLFEHRHNRNIKVPKNDQTDAKNNLDISINSSQNGGTERDIEPKKIIEHIEAPIIHETICRDITEEIQPVIHRKIIHPEIHRIEVPITENINVGPSKSDSQIQNQEQSKSEIEEIKTVITKEPIIIEHHVKKIIREIQPVIHRIVEEPSVVLEKLVLCETEIKAPVVYDDNTTDSEKVGVKKLPSPFVSEFDNMKNYTHVNEMPRPPNPVPMVTK